MEDSKQIPDDINSIESSSDLKKDINKEENIKEFTKLLESGNKQKSDEVKENSVLKEEKVATKKNSLFKRVLSEGFDGISSNPSYKMLALLIILLINLSLFFVIGNIGKAFLKKAGIM